MIKIKLPVQYSLLSAKDKRLIREEYTKTQGGKCMYCGGLLSEDPPKWVTDKGIDWSLFPEGFLEHPVHLQHNHTTGLTEGVAHAYCNAVMWQYDGR